MDYEDRIFVEGLDNFCLGNDGLDELFGILLDKQAQNNPETKVIFEDGIKHLSVEAQEIVNLILDAPFELVDLIQSEAGEDCWPTRYYVRQYLRYNGWRHKVINQAFAELKKFFMI